MSSRPPLRDDSSAPSYASALSWGESAAGVSLAISVVPRASRSRIVGAHGGALKVQLAAPPVDGAANETLITVLAKAFGVSKRQVTIVSGLQSRNKRVMIAGASRSELEARLP